MAARGNRWLLIASMVAAASYPLIWERGFSPPAVIAWKGAGVALLALWAWAGARETDGRLLAGVMALGALGDIVLEIHFIGGAVAFLLGHLVAIALYRRNRRAPPGIDRWLVGAGVVPLSVLAAFLLPADRGAAPGVALYTLFLSVMVATAWASRFPRDRVGLGAMLFLASDLLIFARMGPLAEAAWTGLAVWVLYYPGQWLICVGVATVLRGERRPV